MVISQALLASYIRRIIGIRMYTMRKIYLFIFSFFLVLCLLIVLQRGIKFFLIGHIRDNIMLPWIDLILYQLIILCFAFLLIQLFKFNLLEQLERINQTFFLISIFIATVLITNLISFFVLEHFPHDVDNVARLFQAKTFKEGKLYTDAPSHPEFFPCPAMVRENGKFFSKYNPGSSLVYAFWWKLTGRPWGINPLLSGLTLVSLFFIFKRLYDEKIAKLAVLFTFLSPFYLFMSSSFHSHVPILFFLVMFLLFLLKGSISSKWYHFALSGFFVGMAILTRPYTAILVSLPGIVWLFSMQKGKNLPKRLFPFSAAFAIPFSLLLLYNNALTGNPLLFPFHLAGPEQKIGFGYLGHTPLKGVKNTLSMLRLLNLNLLGWPFSLFFCAFFVLLGKKNRWDVFVIATFSTLIIGYFFYFWIDFSFGPRFYFSATPFFLVLSARGIYSFPEVFKRFNRQNTMAFLSAFVALSFLFSLTIYLPNLTREYHDDYNGLINTKISDVVKENNVSDALIFVKNLPSKNDFACAFLANSIDFNDSVVYAKDLGREKNQILIEAFGKRNYFYFDLKKRRGFLKPYEASILLKDH